MLSNIKKVMGLFLLPQWSQEKKEIIEEIVNDLIDDLVQEDNDDGDKKGFV